MMRSKAEFRQVRTYLGGHAAMSHRVKKSGSLLPKSPGLRVVAAIHILAAAGLTILLVKVHFLQYWDNIELVPLLLEALLWIVPIVLLLVLGLGLLNRRSWARSLALTMLWPIVVGGLGISAFTLVLIVVDLATIGLGLRSVFAAIFVAGLLPVISVSAWILRYFYRPEHR